MCGMVVKINLDFFPPKKVRKYIFASSLKSTKNLFRPSHNSSDVGNATNQGPPKFSAESVIKNPNQTSLHFYRRSCHPFLRLSQTKYLYYTIFNTDELLMNIWRGPGSICSYGRVVKGSLSVLFINVCNGLCAHGEESTIRLEREELSVYL